MLSNFIRCDRGSIMPLFAITSLVMFGTVGAALDYSRAASARTAMQAALDSAALMLAQVVRWTRARLVRLKNALRYQSLPLVR